MTHEFGKFLTLLIIFGFPFLSSLIGGGCLGELSFLFFYLCNFLVELFDNNLIFFLIFLIVLIKFLLKESYLLIKIDNFIF